MQRTIRPFPAGSHLFQVSKGPNKGKWGVSGLEGVQNSLKRFANITIYALKTTYNKQDAKGEAYFIVQLFLTMEELQEWIDLDKYSSIPLNERPKTEIIEMILKEDQIVR